MHSKCSGEISKPPILLQNNILWLRRRKGYLVHNVCKLCNYDWKLSLTDTRNRVKLNKQWCCLSAFEILFKSVYRFFYFHISNRFTAMFVVAEKPKFVGSLFEVVLSYTTALNTTKEPELVLNDFLKRTLFCNLVLTPVSFNFSIMTFVFDSLLLLANKSPTFMFRHVWYQHATNTTSSYWVVRL